jgi:hypothetical protein
MKLHRDLLLSAIRVPAAATDQSIDSLSGHLHFSPCPEVVHYNVQIEGCTGEVFAHQGLKLDNYDLPEFCTRARPLLDLLGAMPNDELDLSIEFPHLVIRLGRSCYKLPAQDAANFLRVIPGRTSPTGFPAAELRTALNSLLWIVGTGSSFTGHLAFCERENRFLLAASDLALGGFYEFPGGLGEHRMALLGKKSCGRVLDALPQDGDLSMTINDKASIVFNWVTGGITAAQGTAETPPIDRFYDAEKGHHFECSMKAIEGCLKRVNAITAGDSKSPPEVKFELRGDALTIYGSDEGHSQAMETIDVTGWPEAVTFNEKYNLRYLLGALRHCNGESLHVYVAGGLLRVIGSTSPQLMYGIQSIRRKDENVG